MASKRMRWLMVATALIVVGGVGAFLWVARQKAAANVRAPGGRFGLGAPMAVAVATAERADLPVRIAALGTITPLATVTVKTQIAGQLQEVGFQEGQTVHKGDFLAQIDPRPYQNALSQAEGTLARDEAQLANARLDVKRYTDLAAKELLAQQQLDAAKALAGQLAGTVATDTALVSTARLNLQYTHIVSPINGRAGLRQVDVGNYVTPGDGNGIVVLTQLKPISAIFPIPQDSVPSLMQQLRAGRKLPVSAFDRGGTNLLATGTLQTVDNELDTTTGTVKLRAQFDNADEALFPNQFVNIQLLVDTLHDQIVVPSAAIQKGSINGEATSFVYRVNTSDSTVSVQPVTLGRADGDRVAITKGLDAGDIVVTQGGDRLRDGARVQLPGAAPPSAAGSGPGANGQRRGNGRRGDGQRQGGFGGGGAPGGRGPDGRRGGG